jgi:AraC-like DNA-binding protein
MRGRQKAKATLRRPESYTWPALPDWPGLLTPIVAHAFDELDISVALWISGEFWHPIHIVPNISVFEQDYGVMPRRWAYGGRCLDQARREQRLVRGTHVGFSDLFVPVHDGKTTRGFLVVGPFATARPTSAEVLERWLDITGTHGKLSDPSFSQYLALTVATLTLEGARTGSFERFMTCFSELAAGSPAPAALAGEAQALQKELARAREPERMWDAVRGMVDERTSRTFPEYSQMDLSRLGLERVPEHVVVGLLLGRSDETDPVDETLRRNAFQRASVALAAKLGGALAGKVGENGVAFLVDYTGSAARTRSRLAEIAGQAAALAREYGLSLHAGTGLASDAAFLPTRYRAALWSAEKALSQGAALVHGEARPEGSSRHLRQLRMKLGESAAASPKLLSPRFDQYAEAVLVHCGYRLEAVRAQLDAGLERLAEPLLATGALDPRSFESLCADTERSADEARTATELLASYRSAVSDLLIAMRKPVVARHDRGTRRARAFMDEHFSEPLTLAKVARVAGFAPDYFSKLWKREEGTTFELYLQALRVERGKQMLRTTSLSVEGVRRLCGFRTRNYFHQVFKAKVGRTPTQYRERA